MPHYPKPFFRKARRLWYVQLDGKQVNLGPDRDAAFQRYHELMARPKPMPVAISGSVAEICDYFLESVKQNLAPDTYEWYRYRLQRFVDAYPQLRVDQLRPFHVETWVGGYRFSVTSRRNYVRSVKRCMRWAKKQGYIETNPIADLEVPAAEHREVAITQPEFDRLMSFVRNASFADLLTVSWETGCRPQESLRVDPGHLVAERAAGGGLRSLGWAVEAHLICIFMEVMSNFNRNTLEAEFSGGFRDR